VRETKRDVVRKRREKERDSKGTKQKCLRMRLGTKGRKKGDIKGRREKASERNRERDW